MGCDKTVLGVTQARACAPIVLLTTLTLSSCAPLPKAEYWDGIFRHLHVPRYSFRVPDGWREARASDYPLLGFNRRFFQTLDDAGRSATMRRAEMEMQGRDASLISSNGAWIQVSSAAGTGGRYSGDRLRFGLAQGEKETIWHNFSTRLIESAPPADKPKLALESIDVEDYAHNRVVKVAFRSDAARGPMHWTVLTFYSGPDVVAVAHVGVPEDRNEGIAGLEAIARTFRFD